MIRITQTVQSGMLTLAALALVILPVFVAVPTVFADDETDSVETTHVENEQETENESEDTSDDSLRETVRERKQEVKTAAERTVERLREKAEDKADRTQERRIQLCQNREASLQNKLGAFKKTGADKLDRLNGAYEKLMAYQSDNAIEVTGYSELLAVADATQATATADVEVLTSLIDEGIDCESDTIAERLTSVKEAGLTARDSLRAYRDALHDIMVSLLQASEATTDDTTETEGEA